MPGKINEQQIRRTALTLGLTESFIRKDHFVTKAIRLLTNVENDYFNLVFQGGTSLSKGYGIIKRLSEDVDFRVITKPDGLILGKEAKRRELRTFRRALLESLINAGFDIPNHHVKVYYEGRYMSIQAAFDRSHNIQYLKPHIAIDCFLGNLELQPEIKNISSLVKVTLGDLICDHDYFPVKCVSINETAAEKWVALTRRVADAEKKQRDSDKHLVRHLYDLYQLKQSRLLTQDYYTVLDRVLEKERAMFETDGVDLIAKSELAFQHLRTNPKWETHWQLFLEQMVYQLEKPSLKEALGVVEQMTIKDNIQPLVTNSTISM